MPESSVLRRPAPMRTELAPEEPKVVHLRPDHRPTYHLATREVIAVFDSTDELQEAVGALERNGFDRGAIRLLARREVLERHLADCAALREGQHRMLVRNVSGLLVSPAAAGLAGLAVTTLGTGRETPRAAGLGRLLRDDMALLLQEQTAGGAIVLWVSLARREREATAREVLARHARDVRGYMS
jgi:hypothetical protein